MIDALLGEVGPVRGILVRLHLLRCRDCRREWRAYRHVLRELKKDLTPPPDLDLAGLTEGRRGFAPWLWKAAIPLGALSALILGLRLGQPRDPIPPSLLHPTAVFQALSGMDEATWEEVVEGLMPPQSLEVDDLLVQSPFFGETLLTAAGEPLESPMGGERP